MTKVLLVDKDIYICDSLSKIITNLGYAPVVTHAFNKGLQKANSEFIDLVILDAKAFNGGNFGSIQKLKATQGAPEVVVITSVGDPDEAESSILSGAWDYVEKPVTAEAFKIMITRVLEYRVSKSIWKPGNLLNCPSIIGRSKKIQDSLELLVQAAGSDANVLITGETGTGKELFAKAIHKNSKRVSGNFVIVDCTSLPETLVENLLFGHVRGAFTDAYANQEGMIKQADKGTLFLDEIGELPLIVQKKFLRVIQEHRFRVIGGSQEISSNFRLVAATNRNLEQMVENGGFREDLLFRLRTLVIELSPLREVREDIPELLQHYMESLCQRFEIKPKETTPEFFSIALNYCWPGNVREMIQALEKALLSAKEEPILYPKHLPNYIRIQVIRNGFKNSFSGKANDMDKLVFSSATPTRKQYHLEALSDADKKYFRELLEHVNGNIIEVCRISGLSRSRLYALLNKYSML